MTELEIIALFTPAEHRAQDVEDFLKAAVTPSRAEPGNVSYAVRRLTGTPTRYAVLERWADDEAFAGHRQAPHIRRLLDRADELLTGPPELLHFAAGEVA
jgi:quinol monooxygenase YgiN